MTKIGLRRSRRNRRLPQRRCLPMPPSSLLTMRTKSCHKCKVLLQPPLQARALLLACPRHPPVSFHHRHLKVLNPRPMSAAQWRQSQQAQAQWSLQQRFLHPSWFHELSHPRQMSNAQCRTNLDRTRKRWLQYQAKPAAGLLVGLVIRYVQNPFSPNMPHYIIFSSHGSMFCTYLKFRLFVS